METMEDLLFKLENDCFGKKRDRDPERYESEGVIGARDGQVWPTHIYI